MQCCAREVILCIGRVISSRLFKAAFGVNMAPERSIQICQMPVASVKVPTYSRHTA